MNSLLMNERGSLSNNTCAEYIFIPNRSRVFPTLREYGYTDSLA